MCVSDQVSASPPSSPQPQVREHRQRHPVSSSKFCAPTRPAHSHQQHCACATLPQCGYYSLPDGGNSLHCTSQRPSTVRCAPSAFFSSSCSLVLRPRPPAVPPAVPPPKGPPLPDSPDSVPSHSQPVVNRCFTAELPDNRFRALIMFAARLQHVTTLLFVKPVVPGKASELHLRIGTYYASL